MIEFRKRESNYELMRIIAMLMIVGGHFVAQSHVSNYTTGLTLWLIDFWGFGFRIAVNLFLMLGCWFMVDKAFSAKRVIKLAWQLLFYSASVVTILLFMGYKLKLGELVAGFFPFTTTLWFATSYLVLLFLSPYLQRILAWERHVLKKFLTVQLVVISVVCTFHKLMDTYLCTIIWFEFIYLVMGYYKKYLADNSINKNKMLILGVGAYTLLVSLIVVCSMYNSMIISKIHNVLIRFIVDYKSLPNLLISASLFIFFQKLKIGYVSWINKLAKSAFAVYLVHQAPGIQNPLWFDFYKSEYIFQRGYLPVGYVVFVTISCYLIISVIDYYKRKYIDDVFVKSKLFTYLENKINNFYTN